MRGQINTDLNRTFQVDADDVLEVVVFKQDFGCLGSFILDSPDASPQDSSFVLMTSLSIEKSPSPLPKRAVIVRHHIRLIKKHLGHQPCIKGFVLVQNDPACS